MGHKSYKMRRDSKKPKEVVKRGGTGDFCKKKLVYTKLSINLLYKKIIKNVTIFPNYEKM